jgi:hypothetical protein
VIEATFKFLNHLMHLLGLVHVNNSLFHVGFWLDSGGVSETIVFHLHSILSSDSRRRSSISLVKNGGCLFVLADAVGFALTGAHGAGNGGAAFVGAAALRIELVVLLTTKIHKTKKFLHLQLNIVHVDSVISIPSSTRRLFVKFWFSIHFFT